MRANLTMVKQPTKRPALTAALLDPGNAGHRVDRCLADGNSSLAPMANSDRRPEATPAPLLCEKGAASADGFDPLTRLRPRPMALSAGSAEVGPPQRVRVWFRVDPLRRAKLKQAAAYEKRTCQTLLASALAAFMAECEAIPPCAATALAMMPQSGARQASNCRRHKIAVWLHPQKRDQTRATAARLGQTIQALLLMALDEELERVARRMRNWSSLSAAMGDRPGSASADQRRGAAHPENAAPRGAEIIPLPAASRLPPGRDRSNRGAMTSPSADTGSELEIC
jgi:hypothetical protein